MIRHDPSGRGLLGGLAAALLALFTGKKDDSRSLGRPAWFLGQSGQPCRRRCGDPFRDSRLPGN